MSDSQDRAPSQEDAWLDRVLERIRAGHPDGVRVGPGHDCAAVDVDGGSVVVTTDVLVDGVHFRLDAMEPATVARKALAVNLSDLAAAAAVPIGFVVGGVLPAPADPALFEAISLGFAEAAEALACPCLGGDTNVAEGPLVLAVTALGAPGPMGVLSRKGAEPGMVLSLTGPVGGSIHGRHLTFTPRVAEAQALARHGVPRAMMDVSDGLALDLSRLCRASGVGVRVDADRIPIHPDVDATGDARLAHALGDGEDFELLVAHEPLDAETTNALAAEGVTLVPIGTFQAPEAGLVLVGPDGEQPLRPTGFDHLG
ncbi:MAG: thiamine-phosphate kinase [Planctomycetota bacterium]|nr:thiamine-phosphate kinase [Planctomycetota bacterium]